MSALTDLMLLMIVIAVRSVLVAGTCPAGFDDEDFGGNCYYFSKKNAKSYDEAKKECERQNAKLISLESEEEFDFVSSRLSSSETRRIATIDAGHTYHDIGVDATKLQSISFSVTACNDAHVSLATVPGDFISGYLVAIGGWANTYSVVRSCFKCPDIKRPHTPGILNCNEKKDFTITWSDNTIRLKHGGRTIIEHKFPALRPIVSIAVATGWGATGVWSVPKIPVNSLETKDAGLSHHDIGVDASQIQSISFSVQACNDAHITLATDSTNFIANYLIAIGGWANTYNVIRECFKCPDLQRPKSVGILDCNMPRHFTISWMDNTIKLIKGDNVNGELLLRHTFNKLRPINRIGVATGWGATGVWTFHRQDSVPYWTSAARVTEGFYWTTGGVIPRTYYGWGKNEPNNYGQIENCIELRKDFNFRMNDLSCDHKLAFVCQKFDLNCAKDFIKGGDSGTCFYFHNEESSTWYEARDACKVRGAELVSFDDKRTEFQFVREYLSKSEAVDSYWISGHKTGLLWGTGQPVLGQSGGQPLHVDGQGDCVDFREHTAFNLNAGSCDKLKKFACEKRAD